MKYLVIILAVVHLLWHLIPLIFVKKMVDYKKQEKKIPKKLICITILVVIIITIIHFTIYH